MTSFVALMLLSISCSAGNPYREMTVTATAYNSVEEQTDSTPRIAAWGDRIKPGMKIIAVSRDLLMIGLDRGVPVHIQGFPEHHVVLDKMNKRFDQRIDIYMGDDVAAAREFGTRELRICWGVED